MPWAEAAPCSIRKKKTPRGPKIQTLKTACEPFARTFGGRWPAADLPAVTIFGRNIPSKSAGARQKINGVGFSPLEKPPPEGAKPRAGREREKISFHGVGALQKACPVRYSDPLEMEWGVFNQPRGSMATSFEGKTLAPVEGVKVEVMGGTFSLSGVLLDSGQDAETVLQVIRETPQDRWFVMLSETAEDEQDVLALIDDQMAFQSVALGTLEND